MYFRSLSASALDNAIECPARFKASNVQYGADEQGDAAAVGSACHGAMEYYVKHAIVAADEPAVIQTLGKAYQAEYANVFGSLDKAADTYKDGESMLRTWFARSSFDGFEVLQLETKEEFLVPVKGREPVPFRYIFDRLDRISDSHIRVVDYKTVRAPLNHEQLKRKIQARVYGLAVQIKYPDTKIVEVEFDLLRHGRVGVVFTRDENADTWRMIKSKAQALHDMPEDRVEERLNPSCRWCVRAASCDTLKSNILVGGINSLHTVNEMVDMRDQLANQNKGVAQLVDELDEQILRSMEAENVVEWETDKVVAEVGARWTRSVDSSRVASIVGHDITSRYGRFRMGDVDALLGGDELTDDQKAALRAAISKTPGNITVKTRRKDK